jgi:DNA replication protein DnaC
MERQSSSTLLVEVGVPTRYLTASWDELTPQIAEPITAYCENIERNLRTGRGLLIFGGYGTGKTSALVLIVDAALQVDLPVSYAIPTWEEEEGVVEIIRPAEVRFVVGSDLYRMLHRPDDYAERLADLEAADLLVIDDFDQLYATDWNVMQFEALMDQRYGQMRSTVMSANSSALLDRQELARMRDRLRETSEVVLVGDEVRSRRGSW